MSTVVKGNGHSSLDGFCKKGNLSAIIMSLFQQMCAFIHFHLQGPFRDFPALLYNKLFNPFTG